MDYNFLIRRARHFLSLPIGRNKHFSFLMKRRNIVGFGYNKSYTTHPIANKYGYRFASIHSELDCILSFNGPPRDLAQYTLVNIRFLKNGSVGLSKPCPICQLLLSNFGITHILYTNKSGLFVELNSSKVP